jgi:hypothetical protein
MASTAMVIMGFCPQAKKEKRYADAFTALPL